MVKLVYLLINFVWAGSQFPASSEAILTTFNKKIASGDINGLHSLIEKNSEYIEGSLTKSFRDDGLFLAVENKHASVVELLLKKGNIDASANNNKAVILAAENGDIDTLKLLLARTEVDPGALENRALEGAAKNGYTEAVRLLLGNQKVDPTLGGTLAVLKASANNHGDVIKLFMDDGRANINGFENFIIKRAAEVGDVDFVRYLLGNSRFSREVDQIFAQGDLTKIQTLVEAGYTINQETLELTIRNARSAGNVETAEYLVSLRERPLIPMTQQCMICLGEENLLEGVMTFCNHQFHAECLRQWTARHNSCPMCRSPLN